MPESTPIIPESKLPINMERYYCDSLELRLPFPSGEMDAEAFVKAVAERGLKTDADKDGDRDIALVFGRPDPSVNYHAHLRVLLRKDGSGRIDLSFHLGPSGDTEEQPPYIEDCAKWLGGFFKKKKQQMHVHANYTFDKSFSSVVTLPFPLTTSEKALSGALVTGLGLLLPNEEASKKTVIIQSAGDETYIFLRAEEEIDLDGFALFSELETLSVVVNTLVKKQEVAK